MKQQTGRRWRKWVGIAAIFLAGIVLGGYLFADTQPRSLLALGQCQHRCLRPSELAGLIASAGIQRADVFVPGKVRETDRCVAIRHPTDDARLHFVVFPKRDIRNLTTLGPDDVPYLLDCLAVMRSIVEEQHMNRYRIYTNGPDLQEITYLHLHLVNE
jgi:hypothetical protein